MPENKDTMQYLARELQYYKQLVLSKDSEIDRLNAQIRQLKTDLNSASTDTGHRNILIRLTRRFFT